MKKAFVRYDNLQVSTLGVYQRLVDLDEWYNHTVPGWDFVSTRFINSTLNNLYRQGVEWAVVSALGNFLIQNSIKDTIIDNCIEANAPLAGHLLDRTNGTQGYYNIDPQFFCLNLPKWASVGFPSFAEKSERRAFQSVAVERSVENFHDDYTPYWLKKGEGEKFYQVDRTLFGSEVIQKFLENDYTLINVDQEIRKNKIYLYPNNNSKELDALFYDADYRTTIKDIQKFVDRAKAEFEAQLNQVYIINTERVALPPAIDHYFGVCGGLKAVAILNGNKFHENTKVNLFDISVQALDYQKYLVDEWDGDFDTYYQMYQSYAKKYPEASYLWRDWHGWENEVNLFLSTGYMTKESFKEAWTRYRKLDFTYTTLDLMDDAAVDNYFSQYQTQSLQNSYIWVSNAYYTEYLMLRYGKNYFDVKLDKLKELLSNLPGRVNLESCNRLEKIK
jgi:hypothetical protein